MDLKTTNTNLESNPQISKQKRSSRLKIIGAILTVLGVLVFAYFVYSVGVNEILSGIYRIGFGGFAVILLIHFARLSVRAKAWQLSVYQPYNLDFKDTLPAVILGEALSSMMPLGILMSGSAKAVAVRKKIPLVAGFSSVATENLFYSLVTGVFVCFGAVAFLQSFELPAAWIYLLNFIIVFTILIIIFGTVMVVRQWNWASGICDWLYGKGILRGILDSGRLQVRLFENLIYGFYRKNPGRILPISLMEGVFHVLGVLEVWFILSRISEILPQASTAVFLESINRLVIIVFKLVPFVIGVDEAGAELAVEMMGVAAGTGVTLAIIRKGRVLFFTAIGMLLIVKRGLSFRELKAAIKQREAG